MKRPRCWRAKSNSRHSRPANAFTRSESPAAKPTCCSRGRSASVLWMKTTKKSLSMSRRKASFLVLPSMLEQTPHQTNALALEETGCLEISRDDISTLLERKPHAGMDLLTTLGRQFHAAQALVRLRANRNPNEVIEAETTLGESIADSVARFGGSWRFIITFGILLAVYTVVNIALGKKAWDPYPFILLNLFLSMLAAIQAPVIMMSQNRQDVKDRLRGELDFDVNRRAESEIQGLARKLNLLDEKVDDLGNLLRVTRAQ